MTKILKFFTLIIMTSIIMTLSACTNNESIDKDKIDISSESDAYKGYFKEDNPIVVIEFKDGNEMIIELFPEVAPNTVNNFIDLIEKDYYDGLDFHRIIENFMIQGGRGSRQLDPIAGEFSINAVVNPLKHYRGVISMARTNDPNSATSQFFIMHQQSTHLDGSYAAFGGLLKGFDILDEYATTATNNSDQPLNEIKIKSAKVYTFDKKYEDPIYYK